MDTNRIKNVALGARAQLIAATGAALDRVLAADSRERVSRPTDVSRIEGAIASRGSDGRDIVIEQVAYTWFNRLCALRYMDVRGYTPVGIVSPRAGETLPAILADARRGIYASGLEISAETQYEVSGIIDGTTAAPDPLGHAYMLLLSAACSMYARSMDYLFGTGRDMGPAIELLAPTDLLSEGSLLQRICTGLDEATCNEGVEVMGWLYQFYVSERKDAFFASKKKATAADIAPATQLFTPNWIVRYLVENSLGRLWMLNYPDSELKGHMDYYVEPEEPEDDFLKIYAPEDITFLDPACGSGHILVYAFDLLYLMYEEEGYRPADIPELILKNNLTGVEIDNRAAEIASFCLEMKALERDSGFLSKDVDAHIVVTRKFDPSPEQRMLIPQLCANTELMDAVGHFDEVGSLYEPSKQTLEKVREALKSIENNSGIEAAVLRLNLDELAGSLAALVNSYAVVVTNPPYMGSSNMNTWLSTCVKSWYPEEKGDLCTCFIRRCLDITTAHGYSALITMQSWMFLSTFERMRRKFLTGHSFTSILHIGSQAFDFGEGGHDLVSVSAFVAIATRDDNQFECIRLVDEHNRNRKANAFLQTIHSQPKDTFFMFRSSYFLEIPQCQMAYWVPSQMISSFTSGTTFGLVGNPKAGITTGDNERFIRYWWEVSERSISYKTQSIDSIAEDFPWYPCNKGGGYRKWFGNQESIMGFNSAFRREMETKRGYRPVNFDLQFKESITWGYIASAGNSFRYSEPGRLFDHSGISAFPSSDLLYVLGFLNTSTAQAFIDVFATNLRNDAGSLANIPVIYGSVDTSIVEDCIRICKDDYNSFETSWDFICHPMMQGKHAVKAYDAWFEECQERFDQLKANEEELNCIFARIYGMEGEVPIEVPDDKVSVRLADLGRDIRSLVSYGVGCMFGRYSLDEPGLILADEGSTLDDYYVKVPNPTFEPDRTGIIPITEFDYPFFGDDIVAQFRRWLAAAYGEDTLGENIAYIEKALGKSLRAYFARDFYNDHVKTYQKRPIYWLFSSPKRGLQALVYLHRYTQQTVATLLADYVRPLRDNLGAQARLLEVSGKAKDASLAAKYDATVAELDAWEHDVIFPLAQRHVELDLDDGVKANYGKPEFQGALRKVVGLN